VKTSGVRGNIPAAWGPRLRTAREQLRETLGPFGAWLTLCGAGLALSVAVLWPMGRYALKLENAWDRPVFAWFRDHQAGRGWTDAMELLTQMGNRWVIYAVTLATLPALALLAPRRRWAPPFLAVAAVLIEQVVRVGLLKVVDRGHPPTSNGTWPSGGIGRIVAIYGLLLFLVWWCARERGLHIAATSPAAVVAGLVLATMAVVEGYTRVYLLKHWLTDALGGYVFGGLLLIVFVYAGRALLDTTTDTTTDTSATDESRDKARLTLDA
jgi:membrane-associated phospholipid phosphatase